jgi:hypothetical protein
LITHFVMNNVSQNQYSHNSATSDSFSQWGEDRLVFQHFGRRSHGTFFESGAFHPTSLSQTYFLEKQGWKGVLVEPVAERGSGKTGQVHK